MGLTGRLLAVVFIGALALPWAGGAAELVELTPQDLDPAAFEAWEDGRQSPVPDANIRNPQWVVGTHDSRPAHSGMFFGVSKNPGPRHLRVGFKHEVTVGSVLVAGGGKVSVLKPDAPYPGDPADESEWLPAERANSSSSPDNEVRDDGYALWNLPASTRTRALRFTHVAKPADSTYAGWLGGVYVLSERFANIAPAAIASASSNDQDAHKLNDENKNAVWQAWANIASADTTPTKPVAEKAAWVTLAWPRVVTVSGLGLIGAGFSSAEVEVFVGPAERAPREALDSDWKRIEAVRGLKNHYPSTLGVDWIDFGTEIATRAVRVRMTGVIDEGHPHMVGATMGGRRVWLTELMAFHRLEPEDRPAQGRSIDTTQAGIPIEFDAPGDGFATLVVEDDSGRRIRNLVAELPVSAGKNTVYWDGTNDLERDLDAAKHGLYAIPSRLVEAGNYHVRGLWREAVHLRYEFAINSPGEPPWPTSGNTGGWTTNHTPASSALFLPAGKAPGGNPLIYLGSAVSEGGAALAWVNLEGSKQGGRGWIGGNWTGAQYLARDEGPKATSGIFAYVGSVWPGKDTEPAEIRVTALTQSGDRVVLRQQFARPKELNDGAVAETVGGLAVYNGLVIFSRTSLNRVAFVADGNIVGTAAMPAPKGLAFDHQGRLLILTGDALKRCSVLSGNSLGPAETVRRGLDDPVALTVDANDDIYVAERGTHHQVLRLSPQGEVKRVYGTPGPPKAGAYDSRHMNNPRGLAVDSNGRLWVTEEDFLPKRVSVWNPDGTLWKAFYGPPAYGGGGTLDPRDPTRFDYGGLEFRIDWTKGESRLERVLYRPGPDTLPLAFRSGPPQTPIYIEGRRFLTNAFTQNPTGGPGTAFLFADRGDVAVPVAGMGRAEEWELLKQPAFAARWPGGSGPGRQSAWFAWSDLNADGRVQPNEITMIAGDGGGVAVQNNGAFVIARMTTSDDRLGRACRFGPASLTPQGIPIYDLLNAETLAEGVQAPVSTGGGQALRGTDGWTILTTAPRPFSPAGLGGVRAGVPVWSYPSLWPGLHASHSAPVPSFAGELIGTTRLLGDLVTPRRSDAGPLFFLNGNLGNVYVFTQDGLLAATLFRDERQGQAWAAPTSARGLLLDDVSPGSEHFFPTVNQSSDGKIHLVAGGIFSAVVRVNGLESIRRIPPIPLRVTAEQVLRAGEIVRQREAEDQTTRGRRVLRIKIPTTGAAAGDWADADWADIDHRGVAAFFNSNTKPYAVRAAVKIVAGNLVARWETGDVNLLENSGEETWAPFKTGGALDLMLGTDAQADERRKEPVAGDLRLLVTQVHGRMRALLYRPVAPGTSVSQQVVFRSPDRSLRFDRVEDVSSQLKLRADDRGDFEIQVPIELLGWNPHPGEKFKMDLGILRGNGSTTLQRTYWNNKATALITDVPGEATLTPELWGTLAIETVR